MKVQQSSPLYAWEDIKIFVRFFSEITLLYYWVNLYFFARWEIKAQRMCAWRGIYGPQCSSFYVIPMVACFAHQGQSLFASVLCEVSTFSSGSLSFQFWTVIGGANKIMVAITGSLSIPCSWHRPGVLMHTNNHWTEGAVRKNQAWNCSIIKQPFIYYLANKWLKLQALANELHQSFAWKLFLSLAPLQWLGMFQWERWITTTLREITYDIARVDEWQSSCW